jgi:hypothetical protein
MSVTSRMVGFSHRPGLGAGSARWATCLLPARWRLLRQRVALGETVLTTPGLVQVRRTRACVIARTAVKGELEAALQIALRRLADYSGGDNCEGLAVRVARPVLLRPDASGRWLVQIGLPSEYSRFSAPVPCNHKVRILAQPPETLAIMRLSGPAQRSERARGEGVILAAIADSLWIASGTPVLRLCALPGLLPWSGRFELAVPVAAA